MCSYESFESIMRIYLLYLPLLPHSNYFKRVTQFATCLLCLHPTTTILLLLHIPPSFSSHNSHRIHNHKNVKTNPPSPLQRNPLHPPHHLHPINPLHKPLPRQKDLAPGLHPPQSKTPIPPRAPLPPPRKTKVGETHVDEIRKALYVGDRGFRGGLRGFVHGDAGDGEYWEGCWGGGRV